MTDKPDFQPQLEATELELPGGQPRPETLPPVADETLAVPESGLEPREQSAKRVIIIGGGIAGLVAAFELRRQGHEPLVLEAQHRVGGRVKTIRDFAPGLYAEARRDAHPARPRPDAGLLRAVRPAAAAVRDGQSQDARLHRRQAHDRRRGRRRSGSAALSTLPITRRARPGPSSGTRQQRVPRRNTSKGGQAKLDDLLREYDQYSIREFLQMRGFSEGAMELYGVMSFRESNMNAAVVEQLREIVGKSFEDMQEIAGGMDQLPRGVLRAAQAIRPIWRRGHGHRAVARLRDGALQGRHGHGSASVATTRSAPSRSASCATSRCWDTPFSREKQKAIRELNYNASTKILFQTRHRFWEHEDGIVGGTTVTDLPIRRICYPSFSDPAEERGVLLAVLHVGPGCSALGRDESHRT